MKFSTEKPPNWEEIQKHFPVEWKGVIVTYGDTIYCDKAIGEQKTAHEGVHVKQQSIDPAKWWKRYFEDVEFRLKQEIEAYKEEVRWVRSKTKDKNTRYKVIRQICIDISSPMYGNMISFNEATKLFNL